MAQLFPNQYKITEISLFSEVTGQTINLDAAATVMELALFEGMFAESTSGNVLILDNNNLIANIPIVGNEKINFKMIDNNENDISLHFKVYSISSYSIENVGSVGYVLSFTSEEYFKSSNITISKAYKNLTVSEIVNRIYEDLNTNKKIEIEETDYIHDLIIPSWTPFRAINWLTSRAISSEYEGASFLFFENFDGYKFKSLEFYMDVDEKTDKKIYGTFINIPIPLSKASTDYFLIREFRVKESLNVMNNQTSGMYSSRVILHDIVKRKAQNIDFNYRDSFNDYVHLEKGMLIPEETKDNSLDYVDNPTGKIDIVPKHYKMFSNESQSYNTHREKILQIRKSQIMQLNNLNIEIVIDGDLEIRTGDVIEVLTPSPMSVKAEWKWDPYLSGKYLITGIRHSFVSSVHTTRLVLHRDSYKNKIDPNSDIMENLSKGA